MSSNALSPSLSHTVSSATSDIGSKTTASLTAAAAGINYAEVFADVDWTAVDLVDLEAQWRHDLELIEKENSQALHDSTSKAQLVLPAVSKAIEEVSKLSSIYNDYSADLKVTGLEIQQIELLNRGLEQQTQNQTALLEELQRIISMVALPNEVLDVLQNLPLDVPGAVGKLERAANELYSLLNVKFEGGIQEIKAISERLRYYNEQHTAFAKRLVAFFTRHFGGIASVAASKDGSSAGHQPRTVGIPGSGALRIPKHEEVLTFVIAYRPLIMLARTQSPREHFEICAAYQSIIGSQLIGKDLAKFFDTLKSSHLLKRPVTDEPSLFINLSQRSSGFGLSVGRASYLGSTKNFAGMRVLRQEDAPFIADNEFLYPAQALQCVILSVALSIAHQYRLVATNIFGQSDRESLVYDLKISKKLDAIIGGMFASLGEKLPAFLDQCIRLDESCAIELLAVLDVRCGEIQSQLPIFSKILDGIQQRVYNHAELFLEQQVEAVKGTKYSAKKRAGVFSYVEIFPHFIARNEAILAECGHLDATTARSRALVNRYYERIGDAIFSSFKQLAAQVEEADEKGHINASVMTIENSHHLFTRLREMKLAPGLLDPILRSSREFYESSLASYASLSIYRALGKYAEYFEGFSNLLRTTAPEEVAFTSTYSKASIKKMLASVPLKDLKKAIDLLRQRVIKHFAGQKELEAIVWDAVQSDFMKRQRATLEGIKRVFPTSTDISAGLTLDDIQAYFIEVSQRKSSY